VVDLSASPAAKAVLPVNRTAIVLVAVSPTTVVLVAEVNVTDDVSSAACEEGADKKPNPIETVTASAIRLKNVFVDIYFLSLVEIETISKSAWQKEDLFAS
jgi:hypothetical protein